RHRPHLPGRRAHPARSRPASSDALCAKGRSHRGNRAPDRGQGPRRLDPHYIRRGMSTIILLVVVSALIAGFSYYTNAGFGDRKPPPPRKKEKDQAAGGAPDEKAPPPHK